MGLAIVVFAAASLAAATGSPVSPDCQAKLDAWHQLYANQGDRFIPITVEDGGYFSDGFYTLIDLALQGAGGTQGEKTAIKTYWCQRLFIANTRGVAKTILRRPPYCTGQHFPLHPHHFATMPQLGPVPAPARPTDSCQPCTTFDLRTA